MDVHPIAAHITGIMDSTVAHYCHAGHHVHVLRADPELNGSDS